MQTTHDTTKIMKTLVVQLIDKKYELKIKDILYLEASSNYTIIHLKEGRDILTSKTLKYWEERLPRVGFVRCHAQYLVNKFNIKNIDFTHNKVTVSNKIVLPISRNRKYNIDTYGV